MILKRLTIHNIASIEDAEIDFMSEPLADADVFLISGKTGSGKSTILDAICLALYNITPRLKNLEQTSKLEHDHDLSTKDPRNLMRRGTSECSVSLTFQGNDGVGYEAIWSAARSRSKADGTPKGKQWSLRNMATGSLLTKDKDVKPAIEAAVGLTFEQFCRTTLLAQGDFLRFLNSKDEDKSEILEKITGTEIYSRIGSRIYELFKLRENEYKTASERVNNVELLSNDQIAEKTERIAAIGRDNAELKNWIEAWRQCVRWLEDEEKLKKQFSDAETNLKQIDNTIGSDDFKQCKQTVSLWSSTIEARQKLKQLNESKAEQNRLGIELDRQAERYRKSLGGLNHDMAELEASMAKKTELMDFILSEEPRATVYGQEQLIANRLKEIGSIRLQISGMEMKIKNLETSLESMQQTKLEKVSERDKVARLTEEIKNRLASGTQKLTECGLHELRERKVSLLAELNEISLAETQLGTYRSETSRAEKEKCEIEAIQARLGQSETELEQHRVELRLAENREKVAEKTYEKLAGSVTEWAKVARTNLKSGDICPVCRQVVNEAPHVEKELQVLVDAARNELNEKKSQCKALETLCNRLESSIKSDNQHLQTIRQRSEDEAIRLRTLETQLSEAISKVCGGVGLDSQLHEPSSSAGGIDYEFFIANAMAKRKSQLRDIDESLLQAEQLERDVNTMQSELAKQNEALQKSGRETADAETAVAKCTAEIDAEKKLFAQYVERIKTLESETLATLDGLTWKCDWSENPNGFVAELHNACSKYKQSRDTLAMLDGRIVILEQETKRIKEDLAQVVEKIPSWKTVTVEEKYSFNGLSRAVSDLLVNVTAIAQNQINCTSIIAASGKWLATFYASSGITSDQLAELDSIGQDNIELLKQKAEVLERERVSARNMLESRRKEYLDHHENRPKLLLESGKQDVAGMDREFSDEVYAGQMDVLRRQIAEAEAAQNESTRELGALRQALDDDSKRRMQLKQYVEEADSKKSLYERWSALNNLIGDSTGKNFRIIAQSYILDNIIRSANHYMRSLDDRYELRVMPGSFVIEVVDAYQGYVARPSSTLSGGEGFLVSLALALALSDVGNRISSNVLFIDEGFGTLSGEPLQNAVNTLKSLHTQTGRHVGIISHIEELRERLPVQIQVSQVGHNSSSTIRVVG